MKKPTIATLSACGVILLFSLVPQQPVWAVVIDTVPVGNAGNTGELSGDGAGGQIVGAVGHNYRIGTTEVTNAQYAEFLNGKAESDPLSLYNANMSSGLGGITRSGIDGGYMYAAIAGRENKPVNHVSWYDAIRFANWLHNGQGSGDTETGAYTLDGGTPVPSNGLTITRNPGAIWVLPSESEWYKAAYHKNDGVTGNYFFYPTSSDTAPTAETPPGGSNSANYSQVVNDLTDVGAYMASDSPYGTFDQGANTVEWNENLIPLASLQYRGIRGSTYHSNFVPMQASFRTSENPANEYADLGFRVATIPEPSTAVLAVLGLAGVLAFGWRRRKR